MEGKGDKRRVDNSVQLRPAKRRRVSGNPAQAAIGLPGPSEMMEPALEPGGWPVGTLAKLTSVLSNPSEEALTALMVSVDPSEGVDQLVSVALDALGGKSEEEKEEPQDFIDILVSALPEGIPRSYVEHVVASFGPNGDVNAVWSFLFNEYESKKTCSDSEDLEACRRDSELLSTLVSKTLDANIPLGDGLGNSPSNVIKHHRDLFNKLYKTVMELPEYERLRNGELMINRELYLFVRNNISSVGTEISKILIRLCKTGSSKVSEELEMKLTSLLARNQGNVVLESTGSFTCSTKCLTRFFFELHEFFENDLTKIKDAELDLIKANASKLIVETVEDRHRARIILMAAKYSQDVYLTPETREKYKGKWFGDLIVTERQGEEQWSGFVVYDEDEKAIVVAFQGTRTEEEDQKWYDFATDAFFYRAKNSDDFGGTSVHMGFLMRFLFVKIDMKKRLRKTIAELKKQGKEWNRLIVTGHSLGGAVATLAAVNLVNDGRLLSEDQRGRIQLITFCQPRVLTPEAYDYITSSERPKAKALERNAIRIWRQGDFVPTLPWRVWGYKHFGQSWRIDYGYSSLLSFGTDKHRIAGIIDLLKQHAEGKDIQMFLDEEN